MPLFGTRGAASVTGFGGLAKLGYLLRNSLRFRASASGYLSRTPASSGNRKTFTYSFWMKYSISSQYSVLFSAINSGGTDQDALYIDNVTYAQAMTVRLDNGAFIAFATTQAFRDPAAWYHVVMAMDTTQATAANRLKLYINGSEVTSFQTDGRSSITQNSDMNCWNRNGLHLIGSQAQSAPAYTHNGYFAEINFVDGLQLTPSSFGKTDPVTGQWIPIKFGGAYGTNGFYLNFTDASAATAAAIGKDSSGNGNNWTPNNISVTAGITYDSMTDVPTLTSVTAANYATLNPLALPPSGYTAGTFLSGNLQFTTGGVKIAKSTMTFPTSGKWYVECKSSGTNASIDWIFGLTGMAAATPLNHSNPGINLYVSDTIYWLLNASTQFTQAGAISSSDVFQIAYDSSTGKVWLGKNNTYYTAAGAGTGNPSSGTNEFGTISTATEYCAYTGGNSGTTTSSINFGQQPWAYTPPTNFVALNTYNLA